jgi:uncharacterized protein (DUF3820 family)
MGQKKLVYYECPIHGTIQGSSKCIQCAAIKYAADVITGKVPARSVPSGERRGKDDPSPVEIMLMSQDIKDRKSFMYEDEDLPAVPFDEEGLEIPPPTPAEDLVKHIKCAMPEYVSLRFWEELKVCIDKELGIVSSIKIMAMTYKQTQEFLEFPMPMGKYVGRPVRWVLKKDPKHLIKMCYRPSFFQAKLRRLLWGILEE